MHYLNHRKRLLKSEQRDICIVNSKHCTFSKKTRSYEELNTCSKLTIEAKYQVRNRFKVNNDNSIVLMSLS